MFFKWRKNKFIPAERFQWQFPQSAQVWILILVGFPKNRSQSFLSLSPAVSEVPSRGTSHGVLQHPVVLHVPLISSGFSSKRITFTPIFWLKKNILALNTNKKAHYKVPCWVQAKQSRCVATKETYSVFKMVEPGLLLLLLLLSLKERENKK